MKKAAALILALCLLSACACAENTAMELNWADTEEAAAAYPGSFRPVATTGLLMYVPDSFAAQEITEEQEEQGIILLLKNGQNAAAAVYWIPLDGMDAEEYLAQTGAADPEPVMVNGLAGFRFEGESDGTKTVSILYPFDEGGTVLIFTCGPMEDEAFRPAAEVMLASVQEE